MATEGGSTDSDLAAAMQAHRNGNPQEAERLYRLVLQRRPSDSAALANLGILYAQSGRVQESLYQLEQAVAVDPETPAFRTYLGHALRDAGRLDEAATQFGEAVRLNPGSAPDFFLLGTTLLKLGRSNVAVEAFRQAVRFDVRNVDAWTNLGLALFQIGEYLEAIQSHRRALELNPVSAVAWLNLGDACLAAKQFDSAASAYEHGLKTVTKDPDGWLGLGEALGELGRFDEALSAIGRSLELKPNQAKALFCRARVWQLQKANELAAEGYREVLLNAPAQSTARFNLAMILADQGKYGAAEDEYAVLWARLDDPNATAAKVRSALVVPVIAESTDQIKAVRTRMAGELRDLATQTLQLDDPQTQIGTPAFYLAYQGENNSELMTLIADLLINAVPDLQWTAPNLQRRAASKPRLRIAFISAHLREHTVGRITAGLIEHLDRSKFEVVVMRPQGSADAYSKAIDRRADRVVELPNDFRLAREIVASHEPDLIYYPDIGMEPFTFYLSFSRLAPAQCVGWGHADTTGVPNVDYYLSSIHFEPPDGQAQYTERLVPLSRINTYFPKPPTAFQPMTRAELELPEEVPIYLCPQSAFKFHPEFDEALHEILRLDTDGIVALSSGTEPHWNELLKNRFQRSIPEEAHRIRFLPRVPPEKFRGLLALADVIIDPKHFTGGHTIYLAFSVATPVVTWEGTRMSGRMTRGLYQQMGMQAPAAKTALEYGELAVRIANDNALRATLSAEIKEKSGTLFEDVAAVREFEDALLTMHQAAASPVG